MLGQAERSISEPAPTLRVTVLAWSRQPTPGVAHASQHRQTALIASAMATPRAFICPITFEIMNQPAVAADGNSYERADMQQWLRTRNTSPLTNMVLHSNELFPNTALRHAIEEWQMQQV